MNTKHNLPSTRPTIRIGFLSKILLIAVGFCAVINSASAVITMTIENVEETSFEVVLNGTINGETPEWGHVLILANTHDGANNISGSANWINSPGDSGVLSASAKVIDGSNSLTSEYLLFTLEHMATRYGDHLSFKLYDNDIDKNKLSWADTLFTDWRVEISGSDIDTSNLDQLSLQWGVRDSTTTGASSQGPVLASAAVPEPSTYALFAGIAGLFFAMARKRKVSNKNL